MTKKLQPSQDNKLPEDGPFAVDMEKIRKGERLSWTYNNRTYFLNYPTDELRDRASVQREVIIARLWQLPEVQALMDTPILPPDRKRIQREIDKIAEKLNDVDDIDERNYWTRRLQTLYEELEKSAAEVIVERQARTPLNRWIARHLLADEKGDLIAPTLDDWERLPPMVRDEATARTALLMQSLYLVRFLSETPPDSELG